MSAPTRRYAPICAASKAFAGFVHAGGKRSALRTDGGAEPDSRGYRRPRRRSSEPASQRRWSGRR